MPEQPARPYTDDDLRTEAARQHAALIEDPDYVGVGEQMADAEIESHLPPAEADGAEGPHWDEILDEDQFDEAQRAVHDLITNAADTSEWAVNLGADGLEPSNQQLYINGRVRIHFGFPPDMCEDDRRDFVALIASAVMTGT